MTIPPPVLDGLPQAAVACGDLGLGPDALVADFEDAASNVDIDLGFDVGFERSSEAIRPTVATNSGEWAMASNLGLEFGSSGAPLRISSRDGLQAAGMFIGLDEIVESTGTITATLQAFGVDETGASGFLGESAVTFPAEPTAIDKCISFEATTGQFITRLQLEYTDSAGTSIPERRVMDDLTIVRSSETVPSDDNPPLVDITNPDDSFTRDGTEGTIAIVLDNAVQLRAFITEDRGLRLVDLFVNGAWIESLGIGTSADPNVFFVGRDIGLSQLNPYRINTITVRATDTSGNEGTDTINLWYGPPETPTPIPDLDISFYNYEITQAIQCLENPACGPSNSIPIFTDKPTMVRVYARATGTGGTEPNISGVLCNGTGECIPALNRIFVSEIDNPVSAYRGDLTRTLNFMLPPAWVSSAGTLSITAMINPRGVDVLESGYDNNTITLPLVVTQSKTLNVLMIQVRAAGNVTPGPGARAALLSYFRQVYPTGNVVWYFPRGEATVDSAYDYTDSSGSGCGSGWGGLLDDLWWYNVWNEDGVGGLRYYGMLDSSVPAGFGGCGYTPGSESGGVVNTSNPQDGGEIMAQEIGHNFGRRHSPGCGAGGPDTGFPAGTDDFARTNVGITGVWGIDLRTFTLQPPNGSLDFIGYCANALGRQWVGYYTYNAILRAMPDVFSALPSEDTLRFVSFELEAAQQDAEYLMGSIAVDGDSFTVRHGFFVEPLPSDLVDPNTGSSGPIRVQLMDAGGAVLGERMFALREDSGGGTDPGTPTGIVTVIMPWQPATAAIDFTLDGLPVLTIPVSPNPPIVELLTPVGGELWPGTGLQLVEWLASDPDGDPLRFVVQFSTDDGATWSPLGEETPETSIEVDTSDISGSDVARVRVIATDGVNTTAVTSGNSFRVEGKAPTVTIVGPGNGDVFPVGENVVFDGAAEDREDGFVEPDAYIWQSDRDGQLGSGAVLWGVSLSQGRHNITLSVTDADGNTANATVTIEIVNPPVQLPADEFLFGTADGRDGGRGISGMMGLLLLGLGAAGAVALGIILLRRSNN